MKEVLIFGGGTHAKVIIDCIEQQGLYKISGIVDDDPAKSELLGYPLHQTETPAAYTGQQGIIAIGNSAVRRQFAEELCCGFITAIHPAAVVSRYAQVGAGSQVLAHAVINAGATVGEHCIINTGAVVEHDCRIGDFVHVSSQAAVGGGVQIGEGTQVGIGVSIIQNLRIGTNVIIEAGATVVHDLPDHCTAAGVPAKPIKYHDPH